ncbi:xylosyltransferase 1 isoform X2 [Hydra vulgaris]|uniref:protein xylosyltransferase n=1 Tax=Hydra vulgaris TaxID=6087 RepID=A0ABM4CDN3_HYDVU
MALRFSFVNIILCIALLIALVQVLTIYVFSSNYNSVLDERTRKSLYEESFIQENKEQQLQKISDDDLTESKSQQQLQEISVDDKCVIKHKDAISAISRAKTESCRNEIKKTACLAEADNLYWTNITRLCPVDRSKGRPAHSVEPKEEIGPPIRIMYAMVVHGRAFRQVQRLFKALFHTNHYFYFHVDSRSDYLYEQVKKLASQFKNVAVAPWRMATIWGGASLLSMLLQMMEDTLKIKEWKWDFFINLSASDYPVQDDEKLCSFLRAHRDENFLKPHGGAVEKFIRKQGISRTFLECDEHMWRLGERKLPDTIDFDGGSDWIALNRKFVEYVVFSEDTLVLGLKHFYRYALLPAESFFHSVLRNSPHCETYAKGNLRLTNWKRKLGCRCQYKHIVDWCGCSPNDYKTEDFVRLKGQTINHFARKFEPIINQEIINMLDQWLYGELHDLKALNSYWENLYDEKTDKVAHFDIPITFLQSFARIASKSLSESSNCRYTPIWKAKEATLYNLNDKLDGVLTIFDVKVVSNVIKRDFLSLEAFFKPKDTMFLYNGNRSEPANRLKGLNIGTSWDQKERIFRNIAGMIGPDDNPTLVHRWVHGEEFHVRIVWQDPLNVIAGMYQMKVEKNWVISFHKPTFNKPLRPGTWVVKIMYNDDEVLGEVKFLVIPQAYFEGKPAQLEDVIASNNGPPAGLYSSDFVIEFDRDANNTLERVKEFSEKATSTSFELENWIDKNILNHWDLEAICSLNNIPFKTCGNIDLCSGTTWSSKSPDPKSEIGKIKPSGRLR